MGAAEGSLTDSESILRSRQFPVLLVLAAIVGVITSAVAWGFLELIYQIQQGVYTHLPKELGFDRTPEWWSLPVLAIAGVITAVAIVRLPGTAGHIPAEGLNPAPTQPIDLPGVVLAALASIGLGAVVGPEAPLIALGGGLGFLAFRLLRRDGPPDVGVLLATASTFAAISFLFGSPVIAAVLLIEAAGLGGPRLPLVLLPGLTAAGIGSLVSIGLGQWTGLSTTHISIGVLPLAPFTRPDLTDFAWTIPLAAAIALGTLLIFRLAKQVVPRVSSRPLLLLPAAGLAVAGLAIAFQEAANKSATEVLFSGQEALPTLVGQAGAWSLSALALLIAFKGLAYAISLGGFRGGPVFPAMFLGAAAGLMAAQLPGFEATPAVAVGIGAAIVAVLGLPLTAVVLALLLTSKAGLATSPLIIVGVVVAYLTRLALTRDEQSGSTADAPA
jgi:chloride channel protein, CIC family